MFSRQIGIDLGAGAMLRSLVGYSADPTLIEGIAYAGYFILAVVLWRTGIIGRIAAPRVAAKSA